jgi:hypothetical protein
MPAPKAVLRDIADFGLDPAAKFGRCASSGRLAHDGAGLTNPGHGQPPVHAPGHQHYYGRVLEAPVAEPAKPAKPARPALVKLAEEAPSVVEEKVETQTEEAAETTPEVTDVAESEGEETVVLASSKKLRAKKAEKPAS